LTNEVLDITTKFQFNPLEPTHYTRHMYDPTPKQTEEVHDWNQNWVQIKRSRFFTELMIFDLNPTEPDTYRLCTKVIN
jgi:hypothetical protein